MAYQDVTAQVDFWNNKDLEEGSVIEGKVIMIKDARDATSSRTVTLELEDGTHKGIYLKRVIDDAFRVSNIEEGEKVRITYLKKQSAKNGIDFYNYKVEVDR